MLIAGYLGALLLFLIIGLCFTRFCFLMVTVEHESMIPTFQHGDRVLALRRCFRPWLRKGMIVLVAFSNDEDKNMPPFYIPAFYIKRVIALSGESITLPMPGHAHAEDDQRGSELLEVDATREDDQTWHVPARHLFVCSDNRERSTDSRQWGPIPLSNVKGLILTRLRRASIPFPTTSFPLREVALKKMLQPGQQAPNFSASNLYGETVTPQDYQGRLLLLLFITTGPVMRQYLPSYLQFAYELEEKGVATILTCDADGRSAQAPLQEWEARLPAMAVFYFQHSVLENYGISIRPAYCLIDPHGYVLTSGLVTLGGHSWQEAIRSKLPRKQSEGL